MAKSGQDAVYLVATLCTLALLIVVCNVFVCLLVYFNKALRTYTNWLIVSLAVSDILTGGVLPPVYLIESSSVVPSYLVCIILLSGVANLCSVTCDRYIAVLKPLEYLYKVPKMSKRAVILSWLIPVAYSLLPLFWDTDTTRKIHKAYVICLQFFGIVVPYVFIAFAYIQIFREVRKSMAVKKDFVTAASRGQKNERRRISSDAKVAKLFCLISAAFILCWLPIIYITTTNIVLNRCDIIPDALVTASFFTVAISSLVNPFIYAFLKPDFKIAIRSIFSRRLRASAEPRAELRESSTGVTIVRFSKQETL